MLSQLPGEYHVGDWRMRTIINRLNGGRFGVLALRHFGKPANARDFLHMIVAGSALAK